MPDSVGGGGFPNNINIGHEHLDMSTGFTYQYLGGRSQTLSNWMVIGGASSSDPNTSGWDNRQAGSMWFNTSEQRFKGWNGSAVFTVQITNQESVAYKTRFFVEDDFSSGGQSSATIGMLGWNTFNIAGGGTFTLLVPLISNVHAGRIGIGQLQATAGGVGNGIALTIDGIGFYNSTFDLLHDLRWIVCPIVTDADSIFRFGIGFETNLEPPTQSLMFKKDAADVNWQCVSRDVSGTNTVDTGIPVVAGQYNTFRINRISASLVRFSINDTTFDLTSNVSQTIQCQPFILCKTNSLVAKQLAFDYFNWLVPVTRS
jgi:hypothetical protein